MIKAFIDPTIGCGVINFVALLVMDPEACPSG